MLPVLAKRETARLRPDAKSMRLTSARAAQRSGNATGAKATVRCGDRSSAALGSRTRGHAADCRRSNVPPGYGSITASATFTASAASLTPVLAALRKIDGKAPQQIEVVATAGRDSKLFAIAANGKRIAISPNGG